MPSKQFKKVLLIRFLAYFSAMIGTLSIFFQFGPLLDAEFNYRKDQLLGVRHSLGGTFIPGPSAKPIWVPPPLTITPVSTDYGIVIEKINANAALVPDVNPGIQSEYMAALSKGVAVAKGSTEPGQPGNLYIFSHSTDAPWNIARFNAVFYLLRELNEGDRVVIFRNQKRYDYIVYHKVVTSPKDISYLQNRYDQPVLTLQTCDPPGTSLNRLIVLARLEGSTE